MTRTLGQVEAEVAVVLRKQALVERLLDLHAQSVTLAERHGRLTQEVYDAMGRRWLRLRVARRDLMTALLALNDEWGDLFHAGGEA